MLYEPLSFLRSCQQRNLLATLFLSQGVPMLLGGDEFGRSQRGNNNAYCQDSELSWVDWERGQNQQRLLEFVRRLIEIRRAHPTFHRRNFFQGRPIKGIGIKDITWLAPDGGEMTDEDWNQSFARCLGMSLAGDAIGDDDDRGQPLSDQDFILLLNSHHERIDFTLPAQSPLSRWSVMFDTGRDDGSDRDERSFRGGEHFPLEGCSMVLLVGARTLAEIESSAATSGNSRADGDQTEPGTDRPPARRFDRYVPIGRASACSARRGVSRGRAGIGPR